MTPQNISLPEATFAQLKAITKPSFFFSEVPDLFNAKVVGIKNETKINWISSCTVDNLFHALERYDVYFSSYFNPLSHTQKYLCKKIELSGLGKPI
mmetsp:Transcript_15735/g.15205  ORF Transcript_15735/g.15205 Transcript_15735/m.15205 type:complete len:96 (+) Transcript_15735:173-460(+)